jgi:hypothetical protein
LPVALFVALVWLRLPEIMRHGRFWAEEGRIYFHNAWVMPWWQALLRPAVGYLNAAANLAGLLARLAPLRQAPHVANAIALLLQTLPVVLLATARDAWLRNPIVLTAGALLLATPPLQEEVWLNIANSQVHIGLATALCLALEVPRSRAAAWVACGCLLLAALCSPVTVALVPLFLARGALERSLPRLIQAACLTAGAIVQFSVFYYPMESRTFELTPGILFAVVMVKQLAVPFFGAATALHLAAVIHQRVLQGHYPLVATLAVSSTSAILLTAIILRRNAVAAWMFFAAAALACFAYYGALDSGPNQIDVISAQRYGFAPNCLLALTLLALAAESTGRIRWAARGLTLWLMTVAAIHTVQPNVAVFGQGPSWKAEVSSWQKDHSHRLAIWPNGWFMELPQRPDKN